METEQQTPEPDRLPNRFKWFFQRERCWIGFHWQRAEESTIEIIDDCSCCQLTHNRFDLIVCLLPCIGFQISRYAKPVRSKPMKFVGNSAAKFHGLAQLLASHSIAENLKDYLPDDSPWKFTGT